VKQKLILFDIDGTLLLSLGAGRRALVAAMSEEIPHIELVATAIRFDGKTDPQIVREMLAASGEEPGNEARVSAILDRYVDCLKRELSKPGHRTDIMPGVLELLDRLEGESSALLGLLTGNVAAGAGLKLASGSIRPERFVLGAYGSDHAVRAELPAIAAIRAERHFGRRPSGAEIVIIGDTPADVTCGAGVGARAIGVATGAYTTDELSAAGAYAAFTDLSDDEGVWSAIWE
jgi:phosphoglycolate phosphatase-like HAD superfamily hydrolase